jgi:hypothetical protein
LVAGSNAVGDETHLSLAWVWDTNANGLAVDVGGHTLAQAALLRSQSRSGRCALSGCSGDEDGEHGGLHCEVINKDAGNCAGVSRWLLKRYS